MMTVRNSRKFHLFLENKRSARITFFLIAMCILVGMYIVVQDKLVSIRDYRKIVERDISFDMDIMADIECVRYEDNSVFLTGWAAHLAAVDFDINLVVNALDGSDTQVYNLNKIQRLDLEKYFNIREDQSIAGFELILTEEQVKKDVCYELLLYIEYDLNEENIKNQGNYVKISRVGDKIELRHFLLNGELYSYNPLTFVSPTVEDAKLEKVVNCGEICSYDIEKGVWIYWYDGSLYWILDAGSFPTLDKGLSLPVYIYTNSPDLIPDNEIDFYDKKGCTHREVYLEEEHCINTGPTTYFVASVELPVEYSITYLKTGVYASKEEQHWKYEDIFIVK